MKDGVSDGDEREGGNDDFVARTDIQGEQGHVEAGGAAADRDGMRDVVVFGERGFEGCELGTETEVRGAQDGGDGGDFSFGDVGGAERDRHG